VVQSPSWLTRGRLLALVLVFAVGAGAAATWSVMLRRRVRAQTVLIRRQLEQQGALERELEKVAKLESLGLLAGGIAHDFNNLLTVILGNLTLARLEPAVQEAAGECLEDAERGAQRARDLTQQLLTFAKGGDPHRTAVSLAEVVREAAEFVLRGSKVACDFDFAHGLWPADVDRGQIGQVVHNLVLNAIQAMPDGGAIRLKLSNVETGSDAGLPLAPGRYLALAVADTGPGMAPAVRARIFDPYFTTKKAGNGLGLATVHSIVRKHKGHIDVVSCPGRGTTFNVWLPASSCALAPAMAPTPVALPAVVAGKRVLVMDDEADIRQLVTTLLHRMGLDVVAVGDGAEAIEAFRAARAAGHPFDLVITDLTVPGGMGGKEAMQALLGIDPAVRVIVSSGYSNDPVLADHRALGFRGLVRKPYEIEELATCVARVLAADAAET
jgi:signal transduction histidine kinase/ActR/RegA family two-component response regulator